MTTKLSASQIALLVYLYDRYSPEGTFSTANFSTTRSLLERGLIELPSVPQPSTYKITITGCEAIAADYDDMIATHNAMRARHITRAYVMETCIVMNEDELSALAQESELDIETLRTAFIAAGGEMIIEAEDTSAPDSETLADELPAFAPSKTPRYEAEVTRVLHDRILIRSKSFGYTIRIDAGETLGRFLVTGDRVTFECNLDWFHNPRAVNVKRVEDILTDAVEKELEQPGPDLSFSERAALDTFTDDYCYMGNAQKPVCECAWCKLARSEVENAALKARNNRLESMTDAYREFVRDMCGYSFSDRDDSRFVSDCVDAMEEALKPKIDHAEIKARTDDWDEAKLDGRPDASGSTRHIDGIPF